MSSARSVLFRGVWMCLAGTTPIACHDALPEGKVVADPPAIGTTALSAVLDDFHLAAAHADEGRYFSHFAPEAVFLGTDAKERWTVPEFRAYAHPHFAKGKAWSFRATARHWALSGSGDVAWFDELLETQNLGQARGSGVLVRREGRWRIAQYNLSLVVPNERFKDVKALLEAPLKD